MREELVTLETAKLAKEKGFDVPCPAGYDADGDIWYPAGNKCASKTQRLYKTQRHYTLAPTQSLLQKWLREKYNIFISIRCDCHGKFDFHGYDVDCKQPCSAKLEFQVDESGCFEIGHFPYRFSTYKKALEPALQEALEVIK